MLTSHRIALAPVLFFALLAPASQALRAQAPPEQLKTLTRTQLDCVKSLLADEKAWNDGDLEGFAKGYKNSPDTLFINSSIMRGYRVMLEEYRRSYPTKEAMGQLAFTDIEVQELDDRFAVAIGKFHLERSKKNGGSADGIFSLTMEKTADGWKIIIDHTA